MAFAGTQQKCKACEKTVYVVDQLTADGSVFHKACFRCHHCNGTLKLSNYSSFEGVLYCKPHFDQLFKRTGSLDKSFEGTPKAVKNEKLNDGVLYCKPHFDQLFKRTRSLDKSFEGTPNAVKNEKLNDGEIKTPNRVSALFSGTQEKCLACGNTVYPIEKVSVEGVGYHKACFKCMHGGCVISPSNYIAIEGRLYCKHHHAQLFKEKGNYSQLIKTPSVKEVSENSVHE